MLRTAGAALFLVGVPLLASAGVWDWFGSRAQAQEKNVSDVRTIALLSGSHNPNTELGQGGGDISIVDGTALASENSPLGDDEGRLHGSSAGQISLYVVREGDTLSSIAEMFDVTANTIRWANDIAAKGTISPGDKLVILPITGVKHVVKKGDTIASVAKKYKGDEEEISQFNGLEEDASLAVGTELIIPNGEVVPAASPKKGTSAPAKKSYGGGPTYSGYYIRPINGGHRSQGIHGYNGVDLAAPVGTAVYASAGGEVIISRADGWNGGYGAYVVIRHDNGTQTLYAHLGSVSVSAGATVSQGDAIGTIGMTGKTTGAHVHFEVRGAANVF